MEEESQPIFSGWLKKRRGRANNWKERYFVLKGNNLFYYLKPTDMEPKGVIHLNSSCKVSEIRTDTPKKRKQPQYVFRLSWQGDDDGLEDEPTAEATGKSSSASTIKKATRKKSDEQIPSGAGKGGSKTAEPKSGYVASFLGWAGISSTDHISFSQSIGEKDKQLLLAADKYDDADVWTQSIEEQIHLHSNGNHTGSGSGTGSAAGVPYSVLRRLAPPPDVRLADVEKWMKPTTKWNVYDTVEGVRVFELDAGESGGGGGGYSSTSSPPCLCVRVPSSGSVADAFMTIMNLPPSCRSGIIRSIRVIETIDNCTDIVHILLEPVYIYPTWTAPRDLCVKRYWKQNSDGSHVICLDSTSHEDCPLVLDHIRVDIHAAYVITPPKGADQEEDHCECLITAIAQVEPRGWLWKEFNFQHNFVKQYLLHVLDIRDSLYTERFVQVHFDPTCDGRRGKSAASIPDSEAAQGTMATIPPPLLAPDVWSDVDASTFRVRGPTYNIDKVKTPSAPNLFKLLAVDLFEVPEPTQNICANPRNRVNLALQRGEKTWVFVMNIMVPGPPFLSFVAYMEGNQELFEQDTPFGRIAKKFFYGNDDTFRNNRFKLIPKVIDGNMIIKMAVKDTPALLGNKLKQYYHKGDNYFEIDIDVGSSSIARNVVGLAIGYSKAIVVDMGLCLQGDEEDELPEVLLGGCSCIHVDCSKAKKL